jgi:hypothetical protein
MALMMNSDAAHFLPMAAAKNYLFRNQLTFWLRVLYPRTRDLLLVCYATVVKMIKFLRGECSHTKLHSWVITRYQSAPKIVSFSGNTSINNTITLYNACLIIAVLSESCRRRLRSYTSFFPLPTRGSFKIVYASQVCMCAVHFISARPLEKRLAH